MKKLKFFYIDFAKEEKWIEQMQAKGYRLTKVWPNLGMYEFMPTEVAAPMVRLDFRQFKKEEDFMEYVTLFEDSGWHHMGGTRQHGCQYFIKTRDDAGERIFSDRESKADMYQRLAKFWLNIGWPFLALAVVYVCNDFAPIEHIWNIQEWYLTPNLWELSGVEFWKKFLFETPFALMRGLGVLFFAGYAAFCGYLSYEAKKWAKIEQNKESESPHFSRD